MERELVDVIKTARAERAVSSIPVDGGMTLFAYMMEGGCVVGLGYDADSERRVQAELVLQRRSAQMERYGAWLPAMFADGSWYVVRRVMDADSRPGLATLSEDDLSAARELLS